MYEDISSYRCAVSKIINLIDSKEKRNLLKASVFALGAAEDALYDADWKPDEDEDCERTVSLLVYRTCNWPVVISKISCKRTV